MSSKTTRYVTRDRALAILHEELSNLPNDTLASVLDAIADSGHSRVMSRFDNFIVTAFADDRAER